MDLGIRGRTTIVCAASRAGAGALAREGVNLVINARSEAALATLADDLRRETGVGVAVAADITSSDSRTATNDAREWITRALCSSRRLSAKSSRSRRPQLLQNGACGPNCFSCA